MALQILDVLRENGIDTVFGIPGGAIARIYAELSNRPGIRVVNATHETNAVFMAMGYSLATGKPAVALTTTGPGFTNCLTGLASAHADGVPILVISGEVPRSAFGRGALQEGSSYGFDALAMARPIAKFAAQIARPTTATTTVRKALATMLTGKPGPAFISLPLDVSNAEVAQQTHAGAPVLSFRIDQGACREAAETLCDAKRPLLIVGAGARSAQNRAAIASLAQRTRTPVAATPKGKGVFAEDDELYLGVMGAGGHDSVIEYLQQKPDVILVVGSSLNDITTNGWMPLLSASKAFMQIDIDVGQLGKNYPVDVGLLGPMHEIIEEMLLYTCNDCAREPHPRFKMQTVAPSSTGMLSVPEAVQIMTEVCPRDALFTSDIGEHLSSAIHFLRTRTPGSFIQCSGFASMGSGIVSAIGLALAQTSRRTFAVCGDGGFLMAGNELATAVRHGAPVTFVIMNDHRLNMCHHGIKALYGQSGLCDLGHIDFAKVAEAHGAVGRVVHTGVELADALKIREGTVVIDVRVDPEVRLGNQSRVASLKQFSEEKQ